MRLNSASTSFKGETMPMSNHSTASQPTLQSEAPSMSSNTSGYLINFTGTIKEGEGSMLFEGARKTAEITRDAPGCEVYEIFKSMDPDRTRTILVFIEWESEVYFQKDIASQRKQALYSQYHVHVEKNSIHGTKWQKRWRSNPFLSPEILLPEPLKPSQGAYYPSCAMSIMLKPKRARVRDVEKQLAYVQAHAMQMDPGVIRFDVYDGVGDDNEGVTLVFGVFKTEKDMSQHLHGEASLLSASTTDMLQAPAYLTTWTREI